MEYVSGENGYNLADGSQFKLTAGGNQIITGGQGRTSSGGDASFRSEEGVQNVLHEGLNQQQSLADSDSRSFTTAKGKTISQQASMLETISESNRTSTGYAIDTSTEEGKAVSEMLQEVDAVNKTNNYGWRQNAETTLGAHAKAGFDGKIFGGSVTTDGIISNSNHSDQQNGDGLTINKDSNSSQTYNNVTRALNNDSWTKDHGVSKDQSNAMHETYEETQRAEKQLSQRHENIDTYQKAIDHSKTTGASTSKDMYPDVLETHAKQSGKSIIDARKDVEARTPEVRRVFNQLAQGEASQVLGQIHAGKEALNRPKAQETLDSTSKQYDRNIDSNVGGTIDKVASGKGFNQDYIKQDVVSMGEINKQQFEHKQEKVDRKYSDIHDANRLQQNQMRVTVNKNEEDRMGKGRFGTLWGSIEGVGRPKEEIVPVTDYSKPAFSNINESNQLSNSDNNGRSDYINMDTGKASMNTSNQIEDLDLIRPQWKQYKGETIAPHDLPNNSKDQGLKITKIDGAGSKLPNRGDGQKADQAVGNGKKR